MRKPATTAYYIMEKIRKGPVSLLGIVFPGKTTNANGQSGIDCGNHWATFERENIAGRISGKVNNHVYAVYFDYDGDHTQPYRYFIGCPVESGTVVPEGLDALEIPEGDFIKIEAKGAMPDCVADAWRNIWRVNGPRAYRFDFEEYDERSANWQNAEVDIFLSV